MRRKQVKGLTVPAVDVSEFGVADADRLLQHGRKHRLKIAGGATDDLKHFRRGRLLLQRFGEVGGVLGEVSGALPQFVEQPRVLDGDDGLGGEVLDQLDLLVGEGTNFLAVQDERADQFVLLSALGQPRMSVRPQFDGCHCCRIAFRCNLRLRPYRRRELPLWPPTSAGSGPVR